MPVSCRSSSAGSSELLPSPRAQRLADNPLCPPGLCGGSVHRTPVRGAVAVPGELPEAVQGQQEEQREPRAACVL